MGRVFQLRSETGVFNLFMNRNRKKYPEQFHIYPEIQILNALTLFEKSSKNVTQLWVFQNISKFVLNSGHIDTLPI
jgi:hypothetical protein